jgi:flagellar hook assembly protein FlgD
MLLDTIRQSSTSYELGFVGNKLVSASGTYGLKAYNPRNVVSNEDEHIPAVPQLAAYPNPFSAAITLKFELDKPEPAKIQYYNIRGQLVFTHSLVNTKAGTNTVVWNGRDQNGRPCASGVYIVKLGTSKASVVRKITRIAGH